MMRSKPKILDATLGLIAESGFEDVTIAAVARAGGVTRQTVHSIFTSIWLASRYTLHLSPASTSIGLGADRHAPLSRRSQRAHSPLPRNGCSHPKAPTTPRCATWSPPGSVSPANARTSRGLYQQGGPPFRSNR